MPKGKPLGPTRTPGQIKKDRLRISELFVKGVSQPEMQRQLGLTRMQVQNDLKHVVRQWQKQMISNIDKAKAVEIAKLTNMERRAWEAYERSCLDGEKEVIEEVTAKDWEENGEDFGDTGGIKPSEVRKRKEKSGRTGDPRYMEIAMKAHERRCKILGLDAPKKTALTTPDGTKPYKLEIKHATEEELLAFDKIVAKNKKAANRIAGAAGIDASQN